MPADALLAYGARLYYSLDNITYNELVDVTRIGIPANPEGPDIDVTPLSPTSAYREFRIGLLDGKEFDFEQHFNKTRMALLFGRLRLNTYWRIVYPDNANPLNASRIEFAGYARQVSTTEMGNPDDV